MGCDTTLPDAVAIHGGEVSAGRTCVHRDDGGSTRPGQYAAVVSVWIFPYTLRPRRTNGRSSPTGRSIDYREHP